MSQDATKATPKGDFEIRARTSRGRRDRVCQAIGAREACLALLPFVKAKKPLGILMELGRKSDEVALANDGMIFVAFDEAVTRRLSDAQ